MQDKEFRTYVNLFIQLKNEGKRIAKGLLFKHSEKIYVLTSISDFEFQSRKPKHVFYMRSKVTKIGI